MTSVAVDPNNPGTYFTTQVDTGVAGFSSANGWGSQGLTGPTTGGGGNLGIPTAATVLTALAPQGSPAGTPATLYRIWQYANTGALLPEFSTDSGQTWTSVTGMPNGLSA